MISIKTRNGNITHDQALIMRETVNFYTELYTSNNIPDENIDQYLNDTKNMKKLSEEDMNHCEGFLTCYEQ